MGFHTAEKILEKKNISVNEALFEKNSSFLVPKTMPALEVESPKTKNENSVQLDENLLINEKKNKIPFLNLLEEASKSVQNNMNWSSSVFDNLTSTVHTTPAASTDSLYNFTENKQFAEGKKENEKMF